MVEKVIATAAAVELIELLKSKHGPGLMFHQSGGCCDNSAANCYLLGELTIGAGDVFLGDIGGCPFYIGKAQYEYWRHTQLIIDVIEGHGGTFRSKDPKAGPSTPGRGCSPRRRWRNSTRPIAALPDQPCSSWSPSPLVAPSCRSIRERNASTRHQTPKTPRDRITW